jgi:hypothetical protein
VCWGLGVCGDAEAEDGWRTIGGARVVCDPRGDTTGLGEREMK